MSVKRILITGGAGFIGYHVAKELIGLNNEVIIYDAFVNYIPPLESSYPAYLEYRLNDIKNKARIIRGDIRNRGYLVQVLNDVKPEIVIHLAAIPIAKASNQFSEEAIQINLNGTITVLEALRVCPFIKRFVFTSSSFVYGDFAYEPADEEHPTSPIDIYGGTKLSGEVLTRAFGRKFNIEYTIIRPSAVYGPTDANRRVTQILIENAILGKPLILHAGGLERVDFTYVKDTAHGFVLAALSDSAKNEVFNITRGEGHSIKDLADILKIRFKNLEVIEQPTDERRPQRGALGIAKAKSFLGYVPRYDLKKGVEEYVDFILEKRLLKTGK